MSKVTKQIYKRLNSLKNELLSKQNIIRGLNESFQQMNNDSQFKKQFKAAVTVAARKHVTNPTFGPKTQQLHDFYNDILNQIKINNNSIKNIQNEIDEISNLRRPINIQSELAKTKVQLNKLVNKDISQQKFNQQYTLSNMKSKLKAKLEKVQKERKRHDNYKIRLEKRKVKIELKKIERTLRKNSKRNAVTINYKNVNAKRLARENKRNMLNIHETFTEGFFETNHFVVRDPQGDEVNRTTFSKQYRTGIVIVPVEPYNLFTYHEAIELTYDLRYKCIHNFIETVPGFHLSECWNFELKHDITNELRDVDCPIVHFYRETTDEEFEASTVKRIDEFLKPISGWKYNRTNKISLYGEKSIPIVGGSYIETPENAYGIYNPHNTIDNNCFLWCLYLQEKLEGLRIKNPLGKHYAHRKDCKLCGKLPRGERCEFCSIENLDEDSQSSAPQEWLKKKLQEFPKISEIPWPPCIEDIPEYERIMKMQISLVVPIDENYNKVIPANGEEMPYAYMHHGNRNYPKKIELLLLTKYGDKDVKVGGKIEVKDNTKLNYHFALIDSPEEFFRLKSLKFVGMCKRCHNAFRTKEQLQEHIDQKFCMQHQVNALEVMPTADYNEFDSYEKTLKATHYIVSDFESYVSENGVQTPNSYVMVGVNIHEKPSKDSTILRHAPNGSSEELMKLFYQDLNNDITRYAEREICTDPFPEVDDKTVNWKEFIGATKCYICGKAFEKTGEFRKICEHDHITGEYRGAAHQDCNIRYARRSRTIAVVFHNGSAYDFHIILKYLEKDWNIGFVIASTNEKFLTFSVKIYKKMNMTYHKNVQNENGIWESVEEIKEQNICITLQFIDSVKLLSAGDGASLDEYITCLNKGKNDEQLKQVWKYMYAFHGENYKELAKKSPYPYEFVSDESKLDTLVKDIKIEDFHSHLSRGKLDKEELKKKFDKFQDNIITFNCINKNIAAQLPKAIKTLRDYNEKFPNTFDDMIDIATSKSKLEISIDKINKDNFNSYLSEWFLNNEKHIKFQEICAKNGIKTLREYHNLYLSVDGLALADIIENIRDKMYNTYKVDIMRFFTLASFAKQCMMRYTGIRMPLIHVQEIYHILEMNKRGGMSFIGERYAEANNYLLAPLSPDMKHFDASKISTYIQYFDANNLYGWAMSQCLPDSEPLELTKEEMKTWTVEQAIALSDDGEDCQFVYLDGYLPNEFHEEWREYPMLPIHMNICTSRTSEYTQNLNKKYCHKDVNVHKLVNALLPHERYLVHYRMLKLAMKHGFVVSKVHKVFKCHQSKWLKPYIEKNTQLRIESDKNGDELGVKMYKAMNNIIYGKMIESIRGRKHLTVKSMTRLNNKGETVDNVHNIMRNIALLPEDKRSIYEINDSHVAIEKFVSKVELNMPEHIGFSILELSKLHMFHFFYEVIQPFYGVGKVKLLMTDTDSLMLKIETEDFYKDMPKIGMKYFDVSKFPDNHPIYNIKNEEGVAVGVANKFKLGCFKLETGAAQITEFIGLKSKVYSYICDDDGHDSFRAKGVDRVSQEIMITHELYRKVLFEEGIKTKEDLPRTSCYRLKTKNHQIYTKLEHKYSLDCINDKAYMLDSIHSVPYGYLEKNVVKPLIDCDAAAEGNADENFERIALTNECDVDEEFVEVADCEEVNEGNVDCDAAVEGNEQNE